MELTPHTDSQSRTNDRYEVFVVYEEGDEFSENELFNLLEKENISFCCIDRHGHPGNTRIGNFTELLGQSKKVLFVVSNFFIANKELMFQVNIALEILNHDTQYAISLLADDKISNSMTRYCLNQTINISIENTNWRTELIQAIRNVPIDFCKRLDSGQVTDLLLFRGLCLQNLRWDVYGLFVCVQEKYLKIDLSEYSKHIQLHRNLQSANTCEQCGFLKNDKTTIHLAFRADFDNEKELVARPVY